MMQSVAYDSHQDRDAVTAIASLAREPRYDAYFGLGHLFSLHDHPKVFRVSTAGLSFGYYLLRGVTEPELAGRILDMGTGSGVQALLLRGMGARRIVASDVSPAAITVARDNEIANFGDGIIDFRVANLFDGLGGDAAARDAASRFDLIVFNPPGWRSPSEALKSKLSGAGGGLDLDAMFHGDSVLVDFLARLPRHLERRGRAIIGLNSLVGIGDVMQRANAAVRRECSGRLRFRLLERIEIPLLLYTPSWQSAMVELIDEFDRWRRLHRSALQRTDGQLRWYYEITEVTVER